MIRWVRKIISNKWFVLGCRVVLAGVFISAAIGKIAKPADFADATAGYQILPRSLVNVFAVTMPWVELLAGLAVLGRPIMVYGAAVMIELNVMFIAALGWAIARHLHIECGCFSSCNTDSTVGWALIARDTLLILTCMPILARHADTRP